MDRVHSIVRKNYDRGPMDEAEDLDVNSDIWCMFMNILLFKLHTIRNYDS